MKRYDARCPICNTINRDLYLEETHGWMECEHCHNVVQILGFEDVITFPVLTGKEVALMFSLGQQAAVG